jgi:hypothetical protein
MLSLTVVVLLYEPCPGLIQFVLSVDMFGTSDRGYKPDTSSCVGYSTYPASPAIKQGRACIVAAASSR